jgi:phosphodiesterase/alkaline phosphatase D-like protein
MHQNAKLLIATLLTATCLVQGAVAQASSTPTLITGTASAVGSSRATLHGMVNPNGAATQYSFEWGPTNAYGSSSPLHSVGHGSDQVPVQATIAGLLPGTTYHYRIVASNGLGGSASGADRTFKTTGHPPAGVATGPVSQVGLRSATVTGTIDPNGVATTYMFEYGLTDAYGSETFPAIVATGSKSVPVSAQLQGLAPGTVFHYRVVAVHGGNIDSYGADGTFVTVPLHRRIARVRANTTPRRDRNRPYAFTTHGRVRGGGSLPGSAKCTGTATVIFLLHHRPVALRFLSVQSNCTFATVTSLKHLTRLVRGQGRLRLRVLIRFRGNSYMTSARARPEAVMLLR